MHFILLVETKLKDITILDDLHKIIEDEKYKEKEDYLYKFLVDSYREDKSLNDVYKRLVEIDDNDLFTFLKVASVPLLKIDKIESYLRIVDTTGITIKRKDFIDTDSKKQLKLLQDQKVREFNDYHTENILIHLPFAELQDPKLQGIKLYYSVLFKANLFEADLTGANLTNSIIINNIFSEDTVADTTNFKDAIIVNHEFFEHLRKNQCKNIPEEEIRNKQELKLKLEDRNLDQSYTDYLLESSKLPSTS
jgi:hypothetical protein